MQVNNIKYSQQDYQDIILPNLSGDNDSDDDRSTNNNSRS